MGALFSKKHPLRLLLLGLDSAGKTTLLRYLTGEARTARQPPEPTVGFSVDTVRVRKTRLDVWDLGGQERQRVLWRHYYAGTNALIFVLDSTDVERVLEAKDELFRLLNERDLQNCTVLILANKQDSPHAISPDDIWRRLQLPLPGPNNAINVNGHTCTLMPVAGATGAGVDQAMAWLLAHSSAKQQKSRKKLKKESKR